MAGSDIKKVKNYLFDCNRWGGIILGLFVIVIAMYDYNREYKVIPSDYISLEGTLTDDFIYARGLKSNYRYFEFQIITTFDSRISLQIKNNFSAVNTSYFRSIMSTGQRIKVLVKKEDIEWEEESGVPVPKLNVLEIYALELDSNELFSLNDLKVEHERGGGLLIMMIIGFGLSILLPSVFTSNTNKIEYNVTVLMTIYCLISLVILFATGEL